MASTKTTAWVGGTAVLALAIAAGAWFVAISPTLSDAADQRQAAADQRDHNTLLETQIAQLKEQYTHLDEFRAELAAIRTQVPEGGDLAELTRELQQVAAAAGVTVTVDAPGTPSAYVAPAPAAAATPEPSATESTDSSSVTDETDTSSSSSSSSASDVIDGLYQIPLSLTSIGTYDQTVSFLDQLQQSMPRLFVVNNLNATSLEESGAGGGRPATNAGDLEIVITGYVLTLQDSSSTEAPAPDATTTPTPLPVPGDQKNPFQPVSGS